MDSEREENISQLIGKAILERRKLKGLSQADLAQMLGIEQHSLSRMENGVFSPKLSRLQSIAKALDCTVADLFLHGEETTNANAKIIADALEGLEPKFQKVIVNLVEQTANLLKQLD